MRPKVFVLLTVGFSLLALGVSIGGEKDNQPSQAEIRVSLQLIAIEVEQLRTHYDVETRQALRQQGFILDGEAPGDKNLVSRSCLGQSSNAWRRLRSDSKSWNTLIDN
jgi:hypothetical protein